MGSQQRRRLIAAGGIVAVGAIATIVVLATGSGSSDSPGVGPTGTYSGPSTGVPTWIHEEHLPAAAVDGAKIFAVAGCTTCHTYAGSGTSALNAPDLTAIDSRHLGLAFEIQKLKCPTCLKPGSAMPSFESLGSRRVHDLAVFLEASQGTR
jgi:cytochrome c553